MSERIQSAERLLATVQAGRAFVRALAYRHLPPGRGLALDLRILTDADQPMDLDDGSFSVLRSEMSLVAALRSTAGGSSVQTPLPPSNPRPAGPPAPVAVEPPPDPGHVESTRGPDLGEPVKDGQGDELLFELSGSFELPASPTGESDSDDLVEATDALAASAVAESPEARVDAGVQHGAVSATFDAPQPSGPAPAPPSSDGLVADDRATAAPVRDLKIEPSLVPPRAGTTPGVPSQTDDADEIFGAGDPLLRADTLVGSDPLFSADTLVGLPEGSEHTDSLLSADTLVYKDGIAQAKPAPPKSTRNLARLTEPLEEADAPEVIDPGAVEPTRAESPTLDEESASFEQTALFKSADIFGDQVGGLDPTAGWGSEANDIVVDDEPSFQFDPNDAQVDELDPMDWGDDDLEQRGLLSSQPIAAPNVGDLDLDLDLDDDDDDVDEFNDALDDDLDDEIDDDDVTRIDSPDPSLLAALRAAAGQGSPQAAGPQVLQDDDSEDFELDADDLHWGNALGQSRRAEVASLSELPDAVTPDSSAEARAPSASHADELDWGADTGGDRWRLDDPRDALGIAVQDDEQVDILDTDTPSRKPPSVDMDSGTGTAKKEEEEEEQPDTKMLSTRAFSRAFTPPMSVPRVVEPRTAGQAQAHSGTAAIQILGHGKAQTLTPTLELGGAPDEQETSSMLPVTPSGHPKERDDPTGSFRLQFEEPEEAATGPRIPVLTESAAVQHQPVVLTSDGDLAQPAVEPVHTGLSEAAVKDYLSHAGASERRGNLREAVIHYDDLLSHDPHNVEAHLGRGRCLVDLGDYGSAMSDFTRAEDIAPDSPEPLVEMGNLFFARKEYKRAITYYNHAIDLDSRHAMAFSRRGISHYHRRQYAEAHHDLSEAAKRDGSIPGLQRYIQMAARKLKNAR